MAAVVADKDGIIVYVNGAFHELYGYAPQEAVGRNISDFWSIPTATEAELRTALRLDRRWVGSFDAVHKAGAGWRARAAISALTAADGSADLYLGLSRPALRASARQAAVARIPGQFDAVGPSLSRDELAVLHLLAQGLSNDTIALLLEVTVETVAKCMESVLSKLSVSNRASAVVAAHRLGRWQPPSDPGEQAR